MKKVIPVLIIIAFAMAAFAQEQQIGMYVVKDPDGWVNVRTGAGTDSQIQSQLLNKTLVVRDFSRQITNGWIPIKFPDFPYPGYIHSSRLVSTEMPDVTITTAKTSKVSFSVHGSGEITVHWGDGTSDTSRPYTEILCKHTYADSACRTIIVTSSQGSHLTGLDFLFHSDIQLTNIDTSRYPALWFLFLGKNQVTNLDVSKNTELIHLKCSENPLKSLDVSHNLKLISLECSNNQLASLDVSHNAELLQLLCNDNYLTYLDVSKNTKLEGLGLERNYLQANALNDIFRMLMVKSDNKRLSIGSNPGTGGCDPSIAIDKGWRVYGDGMQLIERSR